SVSQDLYQGQKQGFLKPSTTPEMSTSVRTAWHTKNHYQINSNLGTQPSTNTNAVNLQFSF
ncbi:MAG: hypothetical protein NXH75_17865, partial [Halobacteriovoraceae bacterium]|nr:hypothetical protein [Halobacteriovoraceae bacterium]